MARFVRLASLVFAAVIVLPVMAQDEPAKPTSIKIGRAREVEDAPLPKFEELELPSAEEFLRAKPFDWIALKTLEALVVEPVEPRPDTLAKLSAEYDRHLKAKSPYTEGEELLKEKRRQCQRLQVTLLEGGGDQEAEYFLETRMIQKIEYYEDLVLRRANLLIDEGRIQLAYDLLLLVDQRNRDNNIHMTDAYETRRKEEADAKADTGRMRYTIADAPAPKLSKAWPKFDETYQKLVFRDAQIHLQRGDSEAALRLLENLWDHNASYPELSSTLGKVVDRLISGFVEKSDYRQARFFLNRLTARDPQHAIANKWKDEFLNRATATIEEARAAAANGDTSLASTVIDRAARIWPDTPGLRETHKEFIERHQIVRLGVLRLPGEPTSYPLDLPPDAEAKSLTTQLLFEPFRVDERGVRYRSTILDTWEPADLGREVRFQLQMKRAEWESRLEMTSADILTELVSKIDPTRPTYDERLAGSIERVSVQSPSQFTIQFRRLPLRLESLLQFSIALGEESLALNPGIPEGARAKAGRERFYEHGRTDHEVSYRRVRAQPSSVKSRYVDEVVEVRYDDWDRELQGLLRGEIVGIPHVGPGDLKGLQDDNRFFVVPYALPVSHFILLNPHSAPLQDGQLRRAVSLALPRDELLSQTILSNAAESLARISATPFPSTSYGHNRLLAEPAYDPQRAAALALTAKKQMGGQLPELRMSCPPDPTIRAAVTEMIEHWRRVGIAVRLNDDRVEAGDNLWDLVYRTTTIVEPLTELWPLLAAQSTATIESLKPLPERVRRQLVDLERMNDWTNATKLLRRIETELMVEARYVPLWEVDEFFVTRRTLFGLPPRLMHPFQDVERWTLQPWYPTEAP